MINLIHHSFSTYYSQERWCAGNANLTAANIKKDITIFGVKGTYEDTTKKLIINNGTLTGIVTSSEYTVGTGAANVDKTKTWGGKNYMLLWHLDQTAGLTADPRYRIDISNLASVGGDITGNPAGTMSGGFPYEIGGDVIISCNFNTTINVALQLLYTAGPNGVYVVQLGQSTLKQTNIPHDGSLSQYSMTGCSNCQTYMYKSTKYTKGSAYFNLYTWVSSDNANLKISCWANRLWIDTSVSVHSNNY